ncbi:MAG: carboxypeptidase-like regulatory domain-containing protein, partial [Flavobacteriales bacterium]|nr:carboxypeptidase-like regulatory domain-containing protein [Flavobacteriales bacterium]
MKNKFKILGALLLLILPTIGFSQGEIQGKVFDEENNLPVPGAQVYVELGGSKIGTITAIDGRYKIKPLNPGIYNLSIKLMGMNEVVMSSVIVNKDKITWIKDVTLSTKVELEEI